MSKILAGMKSDVGEMGTATGFRDAGVYDALARAPLVAWFTFCAVSIIGHLLSDLASTQGFDLGVALKVLARTAALGFVLCLIGALIRRRRPVARASGLLPRMAAIGGTFSVTAIGLFPKFDMPPVVAGASLTLMLLGYGLACYAVVHLGRSLSIMAEARRLVTSGPYAVVRHPLYAAEAVASIGLLLQYLSPAAIALWVVHIGLQFWRMRFEEQVLRQTFPEYEGYATRVARLVPAIHYKRFAVYS